MRFQTLRQTLDSGRSLANPDGLLINGQAHTTFNGDQVRDLGLDMEINMGLMEIMGKVH
ncbi:L-ascorbate oxidase-like protein [Senna tora]|uniref:L-ascorbate oxidase-like protein n=1 Tax=Senna tora TaxID=362788 RepID=A0A834SV58_9FABA|nr:L-ascorbate oxidase-like protein [Senna tora]